MNENQRTVLIIARYERWLHSFMALTNSREDTEKYIAEVLKEAISSPLSIEEIVKRKLAYVARGGRDI